MGKLKKFSLIGLYSIFIAGVLCAAVVKYNAYLVNEGVTFNKSYILPANQFGVDLLSFTSVISSQTIAAVTVDMPAFTLNGTGISGSNTFPIALPVLYTTTVTVGGLSNNTTYYVVPNGTGAFYVSRTSTAAALGNYITFTSTTSGTGYSIRFTPLGITGTPSFKWQVSNDGNTWQDYVANSYGVAIPSVTVSSYVSTGTANVWDFGLMNYAYIRANITAPTAGSVRFQITGNGKNTSN